MERRYRRGRLEPGAGAPARGERAVELAAAAGARIEQILSGTLPGPASFRADHDEWVVVLEGSARLRVDGAEVDVEAGEWLLLPAGCPHTLVSTEPATSWLAVHFAASA